MFTRHALDIDPATESARIEASLREQVLANLRRRGAIVGVSGETKTARMPLDAYLGLVAAMNFKQRTRKMMEYYHADRLHYAVAGTPNRLEYDQGFFVKQGDGAADVKPIAHLYRTTFAEA
jgi:NH3-dependent NAD+ synthetase